MGQKVEKEFRIQTSFGHDGTRVVQQFSQLVQINYMTPEEARTAIKGIEMSLNALLEHQSAAREKVTSAQ